MKNTLTIFENNRNQEFRKIVCASDFKQNSNDYQHRQLNDHFLYRLVDSESGRKQFCKDFIFII